MCDELYGSVWGAVWECVGSCVGWVCGELYGCVWGAVWVCVRSCMGVCGELYGCVWGAVWKCVGSCNVVELVSNCGSSLLDSHFPHQDTVDEDVEQRRKASLQKVPSIGAAEEINEEEPAGYDYEEDFEVRI